MPKTNGIASRRCKIIENELNWAQNAKNIDFGQFLPRPANFFGENGILTSQLKNQFSLSDGVTRF